MFERFTRDARRVVVIAQETARELNSPKIDTRHLLVGLISQGPAADALRATGQNPTDLAKRIRTELSADDGLDAEALATLGIDLDSVSAKADELFGKGALRRMGKKRFRGRTPFTPDAKKSLELAVRSAIRRQDSHIDSTHLLLGLIQQDCPGRTLLRRAGTDLDDLQSRLTHRGAA